MLTPFWFYTAILVALELESGDTAPPSCERARPPAKRLVVTPCAPDQGCVERWTWVEAKAPHS